MTAALGGCRHRAPPLPVTVLEVALTHAPGPDEIATGFALGPGRVVTVAHLLEGSRTGKVIEVRRPGMREGGRTGTVVGIDQRDDLALLAIPGLRAGRPRIAAAAATTEAAVMLVLRNGRVLRLPARVIRSVTARIRTPGGEQMVQRPALVLRAAVQSGDSGAPVLTSDGRIAGVIFARANLAPEVGYAVDAGVLTRWSALDRPR